MPDSWIKPDPNIEMRFLNFCEGGIESKADVCPIR